MPNRKYKVRASKLKFVNLVNKIVTSISLTFLIAGKSDKSKSSDNFPSSDWNKIGEDMKRALSQFSKTKS